MDPAAVAAVASSTTTPSDGSVVPPPQQYRWWYHPHKSWIDIVLSTLMPYILSFASIVASEPKPTTATLEVCRAFREKYQKQEDTLCKAHLKSWSDMIRGPIVEVVTTVPRKPQLLHELCGLVGRKDPILKAAGPETNVPVRLYFPASLLPVAVSIPDDDNDIGAKAVQLDDFLPFLNGLSPDVPIVVCFHSGGLNIGSSRDQTLLHLLHNLPVSFDGKPLVAISVEYGLVPDHPFPAAPVDALSVVTHLLDGLSSSDPKRTVHLAGASSGGYLALVTALELVRVPKYAQRIASVLAAAPMLDPQADTDTYYLNAPSSMIDVQWFRWCWQSYLGLTPGRDAGPGTSNNTAPPSTFDEACRMNSNRTGYTESLWKGHPLERLIRPAIDLPPTALLSNLPLRWILATNAADPLEREGLEFLGKLRDSAGDDRVAHLAHRGSHWFGTRVDRVAYADMLETWGRLVYGVDES